MGDGSQKRLYQYVDIDGTRELMLGVSWLLIGFIPLVTHLSVNTELLVKLLPVFTMLLFFGVMWFKHRVTYPRTGYAMPRRLSSFTLGLFVLSAGSMLFQHRLPDDIYLTQEGYPLLFGAFTAVVLLLMGQGLKRFYAYAVVPLVAGIGSVAAGLGADAGMSLTAFVTGLVLVISGGRVLGRYLARTSPGGDV